MWMLSQLLKKRELASKRGLSSLDSLFFAPWYIWFEQL